MGGHRKNACTDPNTPEPDTIIRTVRNRSSVSLTRKPMPWRSLEHSNNSIENAANSECKPGQIIPTSGDKSAIAVTRCAPISAAA